MKEGNPQNHAIAYRVTEDSGRISAALLVTLKKELPEGFFKSKVIEYMLNSCRDNLAHLECKLPSNLQEKVDAVQPDADNAPLISDDQIDELVDAVLKVLEAEIPEEFQTVAKIGYILDKCKARIMDINLKL